MVAKHTGRGFTLLELIVVLSITGVLLGMATFNLRELSNPSLGAASDLMGTLKKARAKALTATTSYLVQPASNRQVISTYARTCTDTARTTDTALTYQLPSGATLGSTTWSVCYNSRGLSNSSTNIVVQDGRTNKTVQVVLGGGIRIQ